MSQKITAATVRADFNDPLAVVHYAHAAHHLGLWESERLLIECFFTDKSARLLEAGCGAGRVSIGLWELGYRDLTGFDFAKELVDQAISLAAERAATGVTFHHADATRLNLCTPIASQRFAGAMFMFNGLMQIPLRRNRRRALRQIAAVCRPGAPLIFTTHDRDSSPAEKALWRLEALRWKQGKQDPRIREFGDRYFEEEGTGRTFMHLPDRAEILADLAATGWTHDSDIMRRELAQESRAVRDFSDDCRFWVARKG